MRLLMQPGTSHSAYAGLLWTSPAFSRHSCGMLMHAVADAAWHISQCLRWLAIDKLIGQGTLSLGVVSMHSTASKISDPPGVWSGLLHLAVPLAIASLLQRLGFCAVRPYQWPPFLLWSMHCALSEIRCARTLPLKWHVYASPRLGMLRTTLSCDVSHSPVLAACRL